MTELRGIDISAWQHDDAGHPQINFDQVKEAGFKFVIIKATQGLTYQNPHFASDFDLAKEAGLLVGAYHFAWPQMGSGEAEANYALSFTAKHELDLGITLDLEVWGDMPPNSDLHTYGTEFLKLISAEHEDAPQYSYPAFFQEMGGPIPNHKIWAALPGGLEAWPAFWPKPWMIQGAPEEVAGIAGPVDVNTVMSPRGLNPPGEPQPEPETPAEEAAEEKAEPVTDS